VLLFGPSLSSSASLVVSQTRSKDTLKWLFWSGVDIPSFVLDDSSWRHPPHNKSFLLVNDKKEYHGNENEELRVVNMEELLVLYVFRERYAEAALSGRFLPVLML
jgi:hypothetical protein